jgi:hypothetical protein
MDTANEPNVEDQSGQQGQQAPTNKAGRPPPIVLTSKINLIALQKDIKEIVRGSFEFINTRTGTKVMSKEMEDYSGIRHTWNLKQLVYYRRRMDAQVSLNSRLIEFKECSTY